MTNVSPDTSKWHEVFRREVDPTTRKVLGVKAFLVIGVAALLTIAGLYLALNGISRSGLPLAGAGVLAIIVWSIFAAVARSSSNWTGDDLIQIVVADEGVIIQGGVAVRWEEISDIEWEWSKARRRGRGLAGRIGAELAVSGLDAVGLDTTFKLIKIRLKDWKAVRDRGTTKDQRRSVMKPWLGEPAYVPVGQFGNNAEWPTLIALLTAEANRHHVPISRKANA